MKDFKFDDIINMEYPNPEIEKDFPDEILREAQFAPFAALTGHEDAVNETARSTDKKIELDESEKEELDRKLNYIENNLAEENLYSVTYFVPDSLKAGGKYVTITDFIFKIDKYEKLIITGNKRGIPVNDIIAIESDVFKI